MNIIEIYKKYELPEHLQMHMLRVAACCMQILDNWNSTIKVDNDSLIRIALLHDMWNMAKMSEDQINNQKFAKIRKKYINQYGKDDHKINIIIGKQEGLTDEEIDILDRKQLRKNKEIRDSDNYILKICAYCDQRVSPNGVDSLKGRLEELQERHKNKPNGSMHDPKVAKQLIQYALEIEEQVMRQCTWSKDSINDESIAPYVEKLKEYNVIQKGINNDIEER